MERKKTNWVIYWWEHYVLGQKDTHYLVFKNGADSDLVNQFEECLITRHPDKEIVPIRIPRQDMFVWKIYY